MSHPSSPDDSDRWFPAYYECLDDPATRGNPRDVFLYLEKRLDFMSYRYTQAKSAAIASHLEMREVSAFRALRRLVELGYISRGPKVGRLYGYRLVWSRDRRTGIAG